MATRVAGKTPHGARPNRERAGRGRPVQGLRVGRLTPPVMAALEEWSSPPCRRAKDRAADGGTEFGLRRRCGSSLAFAQFPAVVRRIRSCRRPLPSMTPSRLSLGAPARRAAAPRPRRPGDGAAPECPGPPSREYKPRPRWSAAAPDAAGEVPGHRHPQPPAHADQRRSSSTRSCGHGRPQPARAREPERRRRASGCGGDSRPSQAAVTRTGWCCSPTSTSREVGTPGWGAKAAAQLEADVKAGALRPEDLQGPRPAHQEGRRHAAAARRPRTRPVWDAVRPAGRAGADPHRPSRSRSSSPSTSTNERWLELALYPRPPLPGRASSRASRS